MTRQRLNLPAQNVREYAHGFAFDLAQKHLSEIKDIERQCQKSGAQYVLSQKIVKIKYLNRSYDINLTSRDVSYEAAAEAVPLRDKILILHYFLQAKGTPPSGKTITYKELPDGINYFPVFSKRTIQPLVKFFGKEPGELLKTARAMGGEEADYGDTAVTINAFPYVPVTLVIWRGDDEFPPEGSLMFDNTINDYLTNDDIHTLCENITWGLVRIKQSGGNSPDER